MSFFRASALPVILLFFIPQIALAVPQKGELAPPFKVVSTSGQEITEANYRGRVLLLDFFATWCSPCRDSVEHLVKLNQKYGKQGFQILGLSMDDGDDKAVREFIIANRINFPVAFAGEGMQADYAIRSVPVLYVVSKKGVIAGRFAGFNEDAEKRLDQLLRKLLAE